MADHPGIVLVALMIFVYGLFSKLSDRSPVTAPMVFVAMGIASSINLQKLVATPIPNVRSWKLRTRKKII